MITRSFSESILRKYLPELCVLDSVAISYFERVHHKNFFTSAIEVYMKNERFDRVLSAF
jgi:hypothetical protein